MSICVALDLQDCAISTNGAKEFLNAAKYNSLVHIIDIRNNPLVDRDIMEKLIEQLLINCEDDSQCEVSIEFQNLKQNKFFFNNMIYSCSING